MGKIISSYILPHPPIIIPEVGNGAEFGAIQTVNALKRVARDIKKEKPSTIILSTPHAPMFQDYIYISDGNLLMGGLEKFGTKQINLSLSNNKELIEKIVKNSKEEGISCGGIECGLGGKYAHLSNLDHGAVVPLYYIMKEYSDFKLVHISTSTLSLKTMYNFGRCICKSVMNTDEEVVFVASGDLSHRLSEDGPYGYSRHGSEFDQLIADCIRSNNLKKILDINEQLRENAGECGLSSFAIMLGALDGYQYDSDLYSYEGPFGVGYMVARFVTGNKKSISEMIDIKPKKSNDPYVSLAKKALETYVSDGRLIDLSENLPDEMKKERAGVFVSIKKNGDLRGCIGTIRPTRQDIASEIIYNAISAGTQDPRFTPVKTHELDSLSYSVDVLLESEPINSISELDVKKYGVIVRSGFKSGLLLPNLENVDTPEEQVAIALQKAGIQQDDVYQMERFEVIRHK
ncbi:UNVERIFIED_CONTAM: uncharacterized protein (TIGR00296 family)/AmmeMemoRadiSam system protein A/AmmeMemoRadiSam system protein B [Acetivibrio alkalicellulosi]